MNLGREVAFLCGSPRVSLSAQAQAGGPREHVRGIMEALARRSFSVHSFLLGDRMPQAWLTDGEAMLERSAHNRLAADLFRLTSSAARSVYFRQKLAGKVDWVYERHGAFQSLGRGLQRSGVPWVLEANGLYYLEATERRRALQLGNLARRVERAVLHQCDAIVCPSERLKRLLVETFQVPPHKMIVVPSAVDPERFHPNSTSADRAFDGFTVGYVGRLSPDKGVRLLLEGVAKVRRQGLPVSAHIIGDGTERTNLMLAASELDLADTICFSGQVPPGQVAGMIKGLDLGFVGSQSTGPLPMYDSPLKLYEYMAMEVPPIAVAAPQIEGVVSTGKTGFLWAEGSDASAFAAALAEAYGRRHQLAEIGGQARRAILSEHTWDHRVERLIHGIERILGDADLGDERTGIAGGP